MNAMDAVILCGGKGTRLQSVVSDRPKPMAELNGKPFLRMLVEYAAGFGFKRFILCAGYMGDAIEKHFSGALPGLEVLVSRETEPLDTAGAVKNAASLIRTPEFLVMNGDSICRLDLRAFTDFHFSRRGRASVAVAKVPDTGNFGAITMDAGGRISAFREKGAAGAGYVNAGIYILERTALDAVPQGARYSMERELLPALISGGGVYGYETESRLFDIGTPEGYREAGEKLK
jgi:NDP-sugar pyrophosphorylase family protein